MSEARELLERVFLNFNIQPIIGESLAKEITDYLATPEQDPVAFMAEVYQSRYTIELNGHGIEEGTAFYTAPQYRKQPSDDDVLRVAHKTGGSWSLKFARGLLAEYDRINGG